MEPGGSMLHSQGLSNNPYPEPDQPNSRLVFLGKRSQGQCPGNWMQDIGQ